MELERGLKVRCPWCGKAVTLGEWNDLTYSKCVNREMKRLFEQLTDSKAFGKNTKSFYICPSCNTWSRGNQLRIVDTEDPKLKKLGGANIINKINQSHPWS